MILSRWQGRLLVVLQPDHGNQTGLFARAWGNEEVPALAERADAATLAARHHDDGWAIWERHPTIDPATDLPVQFHAVAPVEHLAAYRAGIERAAQLDPWAGLLVSMHGVGLYNDRYGNYRLAELGEQRLTTAERALVREFLADMAALQDRLAGLAGLAGYGAGQSFGHAEPSPASGHPTVRHHYLLLQVWDRLSLQFAYRHARDERISPLPRPAGPPGELICRADGELALTLDPYPFADDGLSFPVRGFSLPDRAYHSAEEFLEALAGAAPIDLDCRTSRPR